MSWSGSAQRPALQLFGVGRVRRRRQPADVIGDPRVGPAARVHETVDERVYQVGPLRRQPSPAVLAAGPTRQRHQDGTQAMFGGHRDPPAGLRVNMPVEHPEPAPAGGQLGDCAPVRQAPLRVGCGP
jgi:hypothetical protein